MTRRLVSVFGLLAILGFSVPCWAQFEGKSLERNGLTLHWQANIGGSGLLQGGQSFVIWPSRSSQREVVSVLVKVPAYLRETRLNTDSLRIRSTETVDSPKPFLRMTDLRTEHDLKDFEVWRVLDQFRADEIDAAKVAASEKATDDVTVGLDGAKLRAESLAKTYRALKKEVEILPESSEFTYLVTINRSGFMTNLDAETGAVIWQNQLSDPALPTFGPGVSDDYVAAVNGNHLYVYGLQRGNLVSAQKLAYVPVASPIVINKKVLVPSAGGRVVSYNVIDVVKSPTIVRLGRENRNGIAEAPDRKFFAWTTDSRLIVAKTDSDLPTLWTSVDGEASIPGRAVAVDNGFVFASEAGTIARVTTARSSPVVWKKKFGFSTIYSPTIGREIGTVVSQNGLLLAFRLDNGDSAWPKLVNGISKVLTITDKRVYALDQSGKLTLINAKTGVVESKLPVPDANPLINNVSDRILMINTSGELICLREAHAEKPTLTTTYTPAEVKPKKTEEEETTTPTEGGDETNIFGSDPPAADSNPFGFGDGPS